MNGSIVMWPNSFPCTVAEITYLHKKIAISSRSQNPIAKKAPSAGRKKLMMKTNFLKENLPLGIGFEPNESDLLHLLKLKIASKDDSVFDFFAYDVHDLSSANSDEINFHCHDDGKIYMFAHWKSKVPSGSLVNRDTPNGLWELKAVREIKNEDGEKVAYKSFLRFYDDELNGDTLLKGEKNTPWIMREFRLISSTGIPEETILYVVHKSKYG